MKKRIKFEKIKLAGGIYNYKIICDGVYRGEIQRSYDDNGKYNGWFAYCHSTCTSVDTKLFSMTYSDIRHKVECFFK